MPKPLFGTASNSRDSLIKFFEASNKARLEAYLDSEKIPTIGYGATSYPDGTPVRLGDRIDAKRADELYRYHIDRSVSSLRALPSFKNFNPHQQAALESFAYNAGPNFLKSQGFRTISDAIRRGDAKAVANSLKLYTNGGTPGLIKRREAEAALFNKPYTVNTPKQQGDLLPSTKGKQGPDVPGLGGNVPGKAPRYQKNASAGAPIIEQMTIAPRTSRPADYLAKQNEAANFATRQNPLVIKEPTYTNYLPSLGDVSKAGIGDLGQFRSSSSNYGGRVFSDTFNAPAITNASYRPNMNLGATLGIKPVTSNYTWAASAPAGNAWRTGFGIK